MACQYLNREDQNHFEKDVTEMQNKESPSLLKLTSHQSSQSHDEPIIQLERGGIYVKTNIGPIQFGIPPETVKDSLNQGLQVPDTFILPSQRFDRKFGINVAEFEFPAYFNFFVRNKQVLLICSKEAEQAVKTVFQETLLGPLNHDQLYKDFHHSYPVESYPDFHKELSVFSRNPKNPEERLTIETLIKFQTFDEEGKTEIVKPEGTLKIRNNEDTFYLSWDDQELSFKDKITLPISYNEYLVDKSKKKGSNKDLDNQNNQFSPQEQKQILMWGEKGIIRQTLDEYLISPYQGNYTFSPPDFGITVLGCSHGFDPKGSTSGYIFWINGRGIMIDPPPYSGYHLQQMGIPSSYICAIVISHCHADHDAGAFHKILFHNKLEIITTRTIMNSFLRKYSAISQISIDKLKSLFYFKPVVIGIKMNIYGALFNFFYSMHTIPCIGFEVEVQGKSVYFSGDTFYDPETLYKLHQQGIMSEGRYKQLAEVKFNQDVILHEAGVPPIHTPQSTLAKLPEDVKRRIYLVHVAEKEFVSTNGYNISKSGVENTMIILPSSDQNITLRRLDILQNVKLFETLNIRSIKNLLDSMHQENFSSGKTIVKEGDIGSEFFIIESGVAVVFNENNDFRFYAEIGDYFGEQALLKDEGRRQASVKAVTDVKLLILQKHDFWSVFGDGFGGQGQIIQKLLSLQQTRGKDTSSIFNKNHFLQELTYQQRTQLEMIFIEEEVEEGKKIWSTNQKVEFAILIKKGSFKFVDCDLDKADELEVGAFVGDVKAMTDEMNSTISVQATRKSIIYKMMKNDLLNFLSLNPGFKVLFMDMKYFD